MQWIESRGDHARQFVIDGDRIYSRAMDNGVATAIKQDNQEMKRGNRFLRSLDWGRLGLRIPVAEYEALIKAMPELVKGDRQSKARAWIKVINSDMARVNGWTVHDHRRAGGL